MARKPLTNAEAQRMGAEAAKEYNRLRREELEADRAAAALKREEAAYVEAYVADGGTEEEAREDFKRYKRDQRARRAAATEDNVLESTRRRAVGRL